VVDQFFARAAELSARGEPFVTATVVRAERPTSAKPGDKAIVTADGGLHGWIGGSCAQPTVLAEAQRALADGQPRLIRLSTEPDSQSARAGLTDLPMTCFSGGTLEIYLEPQIPTPRLLVVGGAPIARALIRLGKLMHYHVIAADLDRAADAEAGQPPEADEWVDDLSRLPDLVTPATYALVASHGSYDEIALGYILRARPVYVALVSSKTRAKAVVEYLADEGIAPELLAALKYPAGLDIQAAGAEEIAVSIMAEIIQRRHTLGGIAQMSPAESVPATALAPSEAIDPVCGMSVAIEGAKYSYEYEGQIYYFCCPGCRKSFANEPGQYLVKG
jgi:xanthine dehydrogenase accessory factor